MFSVPPPNKALEQTQQYTDVSLAYSPQKMILTGGTITNESKDYSFTKKYLIRLLYVHFSIRSAPANNCQTRLQISIGGQQRDIMWYNHQQGASATEQYETYSLNFPIPLVFIVENGDYFRFKCDGGSDGNYSYAFFSEPL